MPKNEITRAKASDFNLVILSPQELAENILCTIQAAGNIAIFGRRGGGKTFISKQAISVSKTLEIYLNLSMLERVDLGGYPDMLSARDKDPEEFDKSSIKKRFLEFIMPWFYKDLMNPDPEAPFITLLLDEVDKTDQSLWAPLLEIIQFHTCNGRALPKLQACIMTGNLAAEGGQRPSLPLLDRAEAYLLESDAHQWQDWAGKSQEIHPSITAYIHDHPDHLFGEVDEGDNYKSASPRGWHNASKLLKIGEQNKWAVPILVNKVSGCIGKQIGIQFKNYYDHYQVLLPLVDKLFTGKKISKEFDKLKPTEQIVAAMITCSRLAGLLDKEKLEKYPPIAGTIAEFLHSIETEIALIAARSQIGITRIITHGLDDDPGWNKLLEQINYRLRGSSK